MQIERAALNGLAVISPKKFGDHRGFFSAVYIESAFAEAGLPTAFVQDNHSMSAEPGTVRGLHFQVPPAGQGKLIRVTRGSVLDIAVDLRRGSPTYGQHFAIELSAANWKQLYVPEGFAHGFVTREPATEVLYKVTSPYAPDAEGGLPWNDEAFGIDWGIEPSDAVLSDRDRAWAPFSQFQTPFVFAG